MDQSETIEGGKDHVHFPVDVPEKWWDGEGESTIPAPIGGGGERDCLGANLVWENLCILLA